MKIIYVWLPKTIMRGEVLVDDEDYDRANKYKWHFHKTKTGINIKKYTDNVTMTIANFILNQPPGILIDHKNGNAFDNQKENLRIANKSQNGMNQAVQTGRLYKGVSLFKQTGKYEAYITINRKKKYLGLFTNPIEAAKKYDEAAIKYFGEYSRLNFPLP